MVVLIASRGGDTRHTGWWYYNLRANPEQTLLIGSRLARYRTPEASGTEREDLGRKTYAGYRSLYAR